MMYKQEPLFAVAVALCKDPAEEPHKTSVVAFFQTDLSGYLPQGVVDSFFPRSMAGFYANLQKAVKKFYG
ncbi:hypothetical protein CB1_001254004 [Camelus ferus]|nr:hypothetical protein CB1_001254004 [Camelus ferus]